MNLFRVSLAGVRSRPLETTLNVILLGLGVGTIVLLLLVGSQLDERMKRDARIDSGRGRQGEPAATHPLRRLPARHPHRQRLLSEANRLGAIP
jgi:putative ABC transport system permease protein